VNGIGLVISLTVILVPITILAWLITMLMLVFKVADETEMVNDALRKGAVVREV
jgi:hypothetical protein